MRATAIRTPKTVDVHHTFKYISLPSLDDHGVRLPQKTFCGGRKHTTRNCLVFLILNLEFLLKDSTPRNFLASFDKLSNLEYSR